MAFQNFDSKGINRRSWEEVRRLSQQKSPEILVEPPATTKNFGNSNSSLMQEMFPASPIHEKELTNVVVTEQKTTFFKGKVDDGGHTFGIVDRDFTNTPQSIELTFDVMQLLDITPYYQLTGSAPRIKSNNKAFVPRNSKPISKTTEVFAEYEEDLIYLNNSTVGIINFKHNFSVAPYVVLTVEPTIDNESNINVFGLSMPTKTSLLFGTSAPFTGYIRYRAAADYVNTWPRTASSNYTGSMKVYAGEKILVNQNDFTSSFSFAAGSGSILVLSTMYDAYFSNTANTSVQLQHINNISSTNYNFDSTLSQYSTVKIQFLAFKI